MKTDGEVLMSSFYNNDHTAFTAEPNHLKPHFYVIFVLVHWSLHL